MTSGSAEADAAKELKANVETFSEAQRQWSALLKESVEAKKAVGTAEESGEAKFSIKYDVNNKPFVVVENDILSGKSKNQWADIVKKNLAAKFPNGVVVGNNLININKQSRMELAFSEYTKWLAKNNKGIYADKFRATNNADEIILASREYINEGLKHARKDTIKDFARGNVLMRIGSSDYNAEVIVGTKQNGEMLLYDIVNLQKTEIKERKSTKPTSQTAVSRKGTLPNENIMLQNKENVNTQFSMRVDSEGRKLSEAQQEFFKDSKVRDEEGLLLTVYHATDNDFTVFDREKLGMVTDSNADDVSFAATAHIGFWFNSNDIKGKTAQNKSLAGYLNIEEPYYVDSIGALAAQIMDNYGEEYGELQERFDGRDYKAAEELGDSFAEWLERKGYDGSIVEDEEFGGTSYVALKSNQFKNADNQNPTENPDIRYSMRRKLDSFDSKEYNEVKLGKQEYARLSAAIETYQPDAKGFVTQVLDNEKGEPAYIYTAFVSDNKLKVLHKKKARYIDEKRATYANGKSESFDKNAGEFENKRGNSSGLLGIERKANGRNDGSIGGNAQGRNGRDRRGSNQDVSDSGEGSGKSYGISDLGKVQYQLRIEDKNRFDILDRQEERYAADLKTLEKAYAEAIRAEYERSIKPNGPLRTDEKPLKLCYNVVCPKERAEIFAKGGGRYGNKSTG